MTDTPWQLDASTWTGRLREDDQMCRAREVLARRGTAGIDVSGLDDEGVLTALQASSVEGLPPLPASGTQVQLMFNGELLSWTRGGHTVRSWRATSGRDGKARPDQQHLPDVGPIPEGEWLARSSAYQEMPERSLFDMLVNELGRGTWPGGESAWGRHRVWLEPKHGTSTYGRTGFSIHGGDELGSAGCIDLAQNMPDFARRFRALAADAVVLVDYSGRR